MIRTIGLRGPFTPLFNGSLQPFLCARRTLSQTTIHQALKPRLRSSRPSPRSTTTQAPNPKNNVSPSDPAKGSPAAPVAEPTPITSTLLYPSAIRIYSRSSQRIALLGIIRLMPFILVTLWTLQIGSTILSDPDIPVHWPQLLQASAALLPIAIVIPLTSGYVARVLVEVPLHARRSQDALRRWVASAELEEAVVEIKTVRANGFGWATTQCRVRELRAVKATLFRQYNFERIVEVGVDKRRSGTFWQKAYAWMSEPPRRFKIATEEGVMGSYVKEPWVWPAIAKRIEAQSGRPMATTTTSTTTTTTTAR